MKKIKILFILCFLLNLAGIHAQDYIVRISSSGPPAGGDVRFAITRANYKIFNGGTQLDSYDFTSDQAVFPTGIMTSNQRVNRIEISFSYRVSSSSAPFTCGITENISLSAAEQDCFSREYTNGRCTLRVELIHTKAAISQPVNDTFCLDDGLTFTRINDCTNATYRWFYNIDNSGSFLDTGVTTVGRQPARIPFDRLIPRTYRGSIRLRARITINGVNYNSNIVIFRTLPCAPEISRVDPINASCGRNNGGLRITFREAVGQEMLFVVRQGGRPIESVQQFVSGSTFTWPSNRGLRSGQYTLTYQPFPGEVIDYNRPINIGDTPRVSFSAVKNADVECFGQNIGRITISASNGNGRYQYRVNGGPWRNFANGNRHVLTGLARGNYRIEVQDDSQCIGQTSGGNTGENIFINGPIDGVTFSNIRVTPVTFRGDNTGAINLAVSGGSRPYRYQWSNGSTTEDISGLTAGFYTLTVIDNNDCSFSSNPIEVTEPDALQVGINIRQLISCNGDTNGVLEALPSGGTTSAGYQYEWTKTGDPTFTRNTRIISNLTPGTYNVTLSNIGAPSISNSETLNNPAPLGFTSFNVQNVACFGESTGAIRFSITGGRPPFRVNWDNGVSQSTNGPVAFVNQPEGDYNFQILDAENCTISNTSPISITESPEIVIDLEGLGVQSPTTVNGTNGAIDITVSGGTGTGTYRYAWTSTEFGGTRTTEDISGLTEGTYTLTVLDANDCPEVRVFELNDPEPLVVSIRVDQDILCFEQKAEMTAIVTGGVTNSAQGYTYQWYQINAGVAEAIVGETNQSITGLDEGIYEVRATDIVGVSEVSQREEFIEPPEILVDGTQQNILCNGGSTGSIDLTATGGVPPLTYEWTKAEDPTFSSNTEDLNNLTFGTYTVVVRDANLECRKERTFIIEQPDNPVAITDVIQEDVKIFGESSGALSITVSGGTPPYSYSWTMVEDPLFTSDQEDITGLRAGNYTVAIRDSNSDNVTPNLGCITSQSFEIIQPDKLEVEITVGNPLDCFGFSDGILEANAMGGIESEDYNYQWVEIINGNENDITVDPLSATIENLETGTYKVIVTDVNGAVAEDTFELQEPDKIVVSFIEKSDVVCFDESNGSITYNIAGGTPFDDNTYLIEFYRGSNLYTDGNFMAGDLTFDALPAGTYDIRVLDKNGCVEVESPDPIEIKQPDVLEISDVEINDLTGFETQNGSITVTISGGTIPYRYEWRRENESDIIGRAATIDQLPIGNYEITIFDDNDCQVQEVYTLEQPDPLLVTIDYPLIGGRVSCNGSTDAILETTVTGGVPFDNDTAAPYYTYSWYRVSDPTDILTNEPTLQNIGSGTYGVTVVDANGNTTVALPFQVIEPPLIEIDITNQEDILCFNDASGAIAVNVSGGTPFDDGSYLYTWSNGDNTKDITDLYAGEYTLTVTDKNGCTMQRSVILEEPSPLTIIQIDRIPASAQNVRDGSVTIQVINGTPPYTYEWFDENDRQLPSNTASLNNINNDPFFVTITDANGCTIEKQNIDDPLPELSVAIVQINPVLCQGSSTASLRANVSGGIPFAASNPYIYSWFEEGNPNPIGTERIRYELAIGSYYLIAEDAVGNRVQSDVFEITGPPVQLEVTLSADYINCGDGNDWTITPDIQGGVPPYTLFWQNGLGNTQELNNVPGGTYTLIVQDARGCIAQQSITTPDPPVLEAEISGNDPQCYQGSDGSASVVPTGGVPPYTYFWSNNATTAQINGLTAGDYFVEITDSKGCQIIEEISLFDPDEIILDIGPTQKILCMGQTYTVDGIIADPNATYRWTSDQGFESTEAEVTLSEQGMYQLVVTTGNQCIAAASLEIIVRDTPLNAEFLLSSDVFVNETFVLANVSFPKPERVDWDLPEGAEIIDINDTYAEIRFDTPGEYDAQMNVFLDGCEASFSETIVVRERSSFDEGGGLNFLKKFTVYPIPNNRIFTIEIDFKQVTPISFNIYGIENNTPILGAPYTDQGASFYAIPMNLQGQNLSPGVYFIILETPEKRYVHKIVIE